MSKVLTETHYSTEKCCRGMQVSESDACVSGWRSRVPRLMSKFKPNKKKKKCDIAECCHICWQKRWRRDATGRRTISPGSIIQIHKITTPPIQSNIQLVTDENTYVTVMVGLKLSDLIRPGSLPKDSGHCGNQSIIIINTTVRIQSVSWSHVWENSTCALLSQTLVIEFKQSHAASI